MISFSVNTGLDSKEKIKKVSVLIEQMNQYNAEYVADAYIKIAQGHNGDINLDDFANRQKKAEQRQGFEERQIVVKLEDGITGIDEAVDPINYESLSIARLDTDYYVETFLNVRQYLYFKEGIDIWRLLKLIRSGESFLNYRVRNVAEKYNMGEFLCEFCSNISYVYAVQKYLG